MSDERYADSPAAGPEGWRSLWREDLRYRPRESSRERFLAPIRRLVRRVLEPDAERQRDFNLVLLDLLADVHRSIAAAKEDVLEDVRTVQHNLSAVIGNESRKAHESIAAEAARLRDLVVLASKRDDALAAALDQKIESVAVRIRDLSNPATSVTQEQLYRRLEDSLRGAEVKVRGDVAHYVGLARQQQPVLDVGCGRGEFLASCREAGIQARGIDANERSVADLKVRGFEAEVAAVPDCFSAYASGSLGSILAMHVVEHLPVDALFALFREAARTLRSGGLLMIETPNAESVAFAASDFWRDPTHLAPRHVAALTVLAREHGFEIAEVAAVHEPPEGTRIPILPEDPVELQRVIHAVNDRFFAPLDLRLVLRRI